MAALATVGAVKALVFDSVFKRAVEVSESDKLRNIVFEGDSVIKGSAECIGSSPSDVYNLSVSINGAAAVGKCSCPAGKSAKSGLCKHVVALLLRRVEEAQRPDCIPPGHASEDEVISIASQIESIGKGGVVRVAGTGDTPSSSHTTLRSDREAVKSSRSGASGLPAASSRRALPAWMLGVVGSTTQADSPSAMVPKKRAPASKTSRPPPPPPKRARRSGQPLRISNDYEEGAEDPGEVEDAGPIQEISASEVVKGAEVDEPMTLLSEGRAARNRRRLRALKKEEADVIASTEGNEVLRRARAQPSKAATKPVEDQPPRARKRRHLVKKPLEDDSDVSGNEAAPADGAGGGCFDLTDDDLVLLAQEQVDSERNAQQIQDSSLKPQAPPIENKKSVQESSRGKKPSTIFSMNKWKELSTSAAGKSGVFNSMTVDLDFLKTQSQLENTSLEMEDVVERDIHHPLSSMETAGPVNGSQDVAMPLSTESDQADAVANDMLDLLFGPALTRSAVAMDVPAATPAPSSSQNYPKYSAAVVGHGVPTTATSFVKSSDVSALNPVLRTNINDLGVEPKPKKKSSLKDKVKMFLS